MTIDDAIYYLKEAKKSGTKNVIISWWEANCFGLEDNQNWEKICNQADEDMELSNVYEQIEEFVAFTNKNSQDK